MKEFFKNKSIKIVIENKSYKGRDFVDIRQYYKDKDSGEFKHTSKGVTIPVDKFKEFKDVFNSHSEKDNDQSEVNDENLTTADKIILAAKKLSNH